MKIRGLLPALPVACGISLAAGVYSAFFRDPGAPALRANKAADSGLNLIMVTMDGVRIDEFLGKAVNAAQPHPLFNYFWHTLAPTGQVYGDLRRREVMTIANPAFVSLPAYQSMFAGSPQPCQSNDCEYVEHHTFPERLVSELKLRRREVATIASWEGLLFAVESHPGTTFINAGPAPLKDQSDAEELLLNESQVADSPPWADCRYDRYTWRHAMRYLQHRRPRFLYISLDDADGWGHQVKYDRYLAALDNYDHWLQELVATLGTMGAYGRNTCLLVTTDHGRGKGDNWSTHSNGAPYSGLVLMYAGCPWAPNKSLFSPAGSLTTHLSIRPTAEALFGLAPRECTLCGESLLVHSALSAH